MDFGENDLARVGGGCFSLLIQPHQIDQRRQIALQHRHVVADKREGVVDLMPGPGGEWTADDGTAACTDASAPYVPHVPLKSCWDEARKADRNG